MSVAQTFYADVEHSWQRPVCFTGPQRSSAHVVSVSTTHSLVACAQPSPSSRAEALMLSRAGQGAADMQPATVPPHVATAGSAADATRAGLARLSTLASALRFSSPVPKGGVPLLPTGVAASADSGVVQTAPPDEDSAPGRSAGDGGELGRLARSPGTRAALPDAGPPVPIGAYVFALSPEAAASPFTPPAMERHAAFLKLVDSKMKAGLQKRHMRDADCCSLAAEAGMPLFGGDSLITAWLRAGQARSLYNQAGDEQKLGSAGEADAVSLDRRSWAVLVVDTLPQLQRRMDAGTVLPGTLRPMEEAYYVYEQQAIKRFTEQPLLDAAMQQEWSSTFGFDVTLHAAVTALVLLPRHPWRADQLQLAQAFVLAAVRLIPRTARLGIQVGSERNLVDVIERDMTPTLYDADFCASVLSLWRSRAVADVLVARGSLRSSTAAVAADHAEFEARRKADVAKRGFRRCALPTCSKRETTVLQFRVCVHCHRVRYCSEGHATAHWPVHRREAGVEGGAVAWA